MSSGDDGAGARIGEGDVIGRFRAVLAAATFHVPEAGFRRQGLHFSEGRQMDSHLDCAGYGEVFE